MRAVHQLVGSLHYGDAVGDEALRIRDALRAAGHASEIYADRADPRRAEDAQPAREALAAASDESVWLYHFSPGSELGRKLTSLQGPLVLLYHNVTPSEFFVPFCAELARLAHGARGELKALAPRAALALCHSRFSERDLREAGYARRAVVPYALALGDGHERASRVLERLLGDGESTLLCVGRVMPNKRIEDLIQAFALLRGLEPRSRLVIVGETEGCPRYFEMLVGLVAALRLHDRVLFTGHVDADELLACYARAQAFACLSEHEGFGVPLIEAMAAGVPVVAFDAGAVRETLRGGGALLAEKRPATVAGLCHEAMRPGRLRDALLATQERALSAWRRVDFGAELLRALRPVLA